MNGPKYTGGGEKKNSSPFCRPASKQNAVLLGKNTELGTSANFETSHVKKDIKTINLIIQAARQSHPYGDRRRLDAFGVRLCNETQPSGVLYTPENPTNLKWWSRCIVLQD